jgi:hypothetical protein
LVQETTLGTDALSRYACSTIGEVLAAGGPPFTAIVVGAGAYGAYCATKLFRDSPATRVLLLDAGSFLVPEHVQNLGPIGLGIPGAIPPASDPGVARELVWGLPWRGNVDFPGLAYCSGGKSLYWGGWGPRLTPGDLTRWPADVASFLNAEYTTVESETGVVPDTDFIFGDLLSALSTRLAPALPGIADIETGLGTNGLQVAPIAVQGSSPVSGLFSFDKFSSLPLLVSAVRADVDQSGSSDARRRLFLVPRAHVIRLHTSAGTVTGVEVDVLGHRHVVPVPPGCAVVLAASAIESTRLALHSFPTSLMGRNLMAHVRSDFTVRVRRSALPPLPGHVQTAALLVRGLAPTGRFHLQVTASTSRGGSDDLLFKMIPDLEQLQAHTSNTDPDWVTFTIRGIGEMQGQQGAPAANNSWIDLSPFESDEFGVPRAFVHLVATPQDVATWQSMDAAALAVAQAIAAGGQIEYFYDGGWQATPFPLSRPFPSWHNGLGSTYHESGTMWMGTALANSVTDTVGRFHHVSNAYACDQSLFPTVGSVNPVITGLTLARRLVAHLT